MTYIRSSFAFIFFNIGVLSALAAQYYVSPQGLPTNNGSISSPWNLQTALNHPAAVRPGDTIWLRGGTYSGSFISYLRGTTSAPIIVRQYAGERAIIDGGPSSAATLLLGGAATWFWGFEVTNSSTAPRTTMGSSFSLRANGVLISGPNIKCINLIVHDVGNEGFGVFSNATEAEVYGSIVYYVGWSDEFRGHGMGIYIQNRDPGYRRVEDNIMFFNFGDGVNAYGSSNTVLNNIWIEGNTLFHNGLIGQEPDQRGLRLGGGVLARDNRILNNYFYNPMDYSTSANIDPSYGLGSVNTILRGNYSVGHTSVRYPARMTNFTADGNTFIGRVMDFDQLSRTLNTFADQQGSTPRVFVRPNRYEPGMGYVTIYNPSLSATISVNPAGILVAGDTYEIRNAQNVTGAAVLQGTYTSGNINFPMTAGPVARAVGTVPRQPYSTLPGFGAFVLRKTSGTGSGGSGGSGGGSGGSGGGSGGGTAATMSMEAEAVTRVAPMSIGSDNTASQGRYIYTTVPNSGASTLSFTIPTAGQYYIWARVKAPSSATDSFFVRVDSGVENIFDVAGVNGWSPQWQWRLLNARVGNTVAAINPWMQNFTAGAHTIRVRGREAFTYLDRVIITNDPAYTPQ